MIVSPEFTVLAYVMIAYAAYLLFVVDVSLLHPPINRPRK